MPRLSALKPPFEPSVDKLLGAMMPPGVPPIGLFRTMVRNLPMTAAMYGFGAYELSRRLTVSLREREIIILRTCAGCRAEYEWGVHVGVFGRRAGLTGEQITALTLGQVGNEGWTAREELLIRLVDAMLATRDVPDDLWADLKSQFRDVELLDVLTLCGWYQAISQLCRALRVDLEASAPRFDDYASVPLRARVESDG